MGYSMGARLALAILDSGVLKVEDLVLVSGTPGLQAANERKQRVQKDAELATQLRQIGLHPFLNNWYSGSMWGNLTQHPR